MDRQTYSLHHGDFPRTGRRSSGRFRALVERARELEREHGFRLSDADYESAMDLRHAMTLFRHLPSCQEPR